MSFGRAWAESQREMAGAGMQHPHFSMVTGAVLVVGLSEGTSNPKPTETEMNGKE
jgi:hypothetical protein